MYTKIKKLTVPLAIVAALALAAPALAAKNTTYKGKTSSGHPLTFKMKGNRITSWTGGIRMSCISIQGGGAPMGGTELFSFKGNLKFKAHSRFSFKDAVAFYYNEVTKNHDLWLKRKAGGVITGKMRMQYEFLIPKYTPGTFSIYSCLGGATFKAKAVR